MSQLELLFLLDTQLTLFYIHNHRGQQMLLITDYCLILYSIVVFEQLDLFHPLNN